MHGQALALSKTMRIPLVLILSKRRMRFLWGHSRIPLRHLHILMTEHLADGLHRHTCLQRNEAGERVSSRMVGIVLFSTSTSKAFWMESNNCSMSLLVSTASLLLFSFGCFSAYVNRSTIIAIILLILRSFQRKGLCNSGLKAKSTTFAYNNLTRDKNIQILGNQILKRMGRYDAKYKRYKPIIEE